MPAKFSAKVMQLRFMQRAAQKSSKADDHEATMHAEETQPNEEHWVIEGAKDTTGCVVIMEGDPLIDVSMGRRSFNGGAHVEEPTTQQQDTKQENTDEKIDMIQKKRQRDDNTKQSKKSKKKHNTSNNPSLGSGGGIQKHPKRKNHKRYIDS